MIIPNFTIRRIDRSDEAFLWEILYHALYVPEGHAPFPRNIIDEPDIAKYVSRWGKKDDQGYIVVDDSGGQRVGAAWIRLFPANDRGYGYINGDIPELSIAILPEYRNRGLGNKLLERLIEYAAQKYPALSLSVSVENPAVELYKRFGFEIVDQHGDSLTMIKGLRKKKEPRT